MSKVVDGPELQVSVSGQVNEVKCVFGADAVDLGPISVH